jgi:diacylglycerol kinase family enzyme
MHAVLIENPLAGKNTPGSIRVAERALEATFDLELVTTNARGHASALAREAVEAGAKTVIAYGGDGTVNEVINGLLAGGASSEVVLAVLPGGTTNVLARSLGFENDLVEATARLISLVERGEPQRLTVGRIVAEGDHGHLQRDFAFAAGVVLDAEVVRRVEGERRRPGWNDAVFMYHGFRSFGRLRKEGTPLLHIDTTDGTQDAYWACIATVHPFTFFRKRPLRLVPDAAQTQGLDLVASKQARFWRTLRWLQQTLTSGKHVRHPDSIHITDASEIRIRADRPVPLQTDGEFLGEITSLRATPLRDALTVWA